MEDVNQTVEELFEKQLVRVRHRLAGVVRRAHERRREQTNLVLADMDFHHRLNIVLHGGMGPRRPDLSQLDGDYE